MGVDPDIYAFSKGAQVAVAVAVEVPGAAEGALPRALRVMGQNDFLLVHLDAKGGLQVGVGVTDQGQSTGCE